MKRYLFILLAAALLLTGCSASFNARAHVPTAASEPFAAQSLTREQARDLALADAGLTADQVTRLEVEYDTDDGIARYEVSFHYDGWEYDYEYNAETGALLSYDRDREIR